MNCEMEDCENLADYKAINFEMRVCETCYKELLYNESFTYDDFNLIRNKGEDIWD
jgi:hypothetical protein